MSLPTVIWPLKKVDHVLAVDRDVMLVPECERADK